MVAASNLDELKELEKKYNEVNDKVFKFQEQEQRLSNEVTNKPFKKNTNYKNQ